jgi:hypothetical protein
VYVTNLLKQGDYNELCKECAKLRPKLKEELDCLAQNRRGCFVPRTCRIPAMFAQQEDRLSRLTGRALQLSSFPIEFRSYPVGAQMAWHVDDCLFAEPQYELIFTVSNSSDSYTEWMDEEGEYHQEWTQPNSLLLVQAAGFSHRVTPIRRGERSILKLIMTSTHTTLPLFDDYVRRDAFRKR